MIMNQDIRAIYTTDFLWYGTDKNGTGIQKKQYRCPFTFPNFVRTKWHEIKVGTVKRSFKLYCCFDFGQRKSPVRQNFGTVTVYTTPISFAVPFFAFLDYLFTRSKYQQHFGSASMEMQHDGSVYIAKFIRTKMLFWYPYCFYPYRTKKDSVV